jgi:hypothetical protein
MDRTHGGSERERRDAGQDQRPGNGERQRAADREARDWASQTGYRSAANQRRDEPMPASRDDDPRQDAVLRNEEHAGDHEQARPSPRAPSQRPGHDKARDDRE